MKVLPDRIEELFANEIPDGKDRAILRPISLQTIEGKKTFSQFPKMAGPTESDLDFVSKEFIDSQLANIATTKSYTFSLTTDHLSQSYAVLPIRINPSALGVVRFKVEGSGGFITVGNGVILTVLTAESCILNWSGYAAMSRAVVGDKVTVIYQGWAPAGAVVLCFSHFTEASVIANPFDFYGIVTYPEPDCAATWVPLNATNGYGNQWNRSESEVHFGYGGDPLGGS